MRSAELLMIDAQLLIFYFGHWYRLQYMLFTLLHYDPNHKEQGSKEPNVQCGTVVQNNEGGYLCRYCSGEFGKFNGAQKKMRTKFPTELFLSFVAVACVPAIFALRLNQMEEMNDFEVIY